MIAWHCGDCVRGLRGMDAATLDLVVTSPPYGSLRHFDGHIMTEQTFEEAAEELWRCIKPGGIVCWQEGDQVIDGSLTDTPFRHLLHFRDLGFRHHDTLLTGVKGGRPNSRRYCNPPQYVWVLSHGRPKTVNLLTKPNKYCGATGAFNWRESNGAKKRRHRVAINERGIKSCYWFYAIANHTEPEFRGRHSATMHEYLAHDLIASYSNPFDVICDPFGGIATTGKWAVLLARSFVGWEINPESHRWGRVRLDKAVDVACEEALANLRANL